MPKLYYCENTKENTRQIQEKTKKENKKINFKNYKDNTIKSLHEVEYFLNNFNDFSKYLKLYKILK